MNPLFGTQRSNIQAGMRVDIVLKKDQRSDAEEETLTSGKVQRILTSKSIHPRGIKVRLESGEVGRVRAIYIDGARHENPPYTSSSRGSTTGASNAADDDFDNFI